MESGLSDRNNPATNKLKGLTTAESQWSPVLETGTIFEELLYYLRDCSLNGVRSWRPEQSLTLVACTPQQAPVSMESGLGDRNNTALQVQPDLLVLSQWSPVLETGTM